MKNKIADIIPHDKALHFIAGVLIFAVFNLIHPAFGMVAVVFGAIGSEIYDQSQGRAFSVKDIAFTVAGGLIGLLISLT